ncbi:MAG: hypothetical protein IJJ06_09525 [Mogibacterium sp.]|nr:hypothetical protein [Mogibacterium sp.]
MFKERGMYRHLMAAILSFIMIFSGFSFLAFAAEDSGTVFEAINLGTRKTITFENQKSRFYKVTIPKKGLYRIDYYSDYHNSYNDDFWVGVYKTQSDAENMNNIINCSYGIYNSDTPETDYDIYSLNAGTYYLHVQSFSSKYPDFGIRVKAATDDDLYELYTDNSYYAGVKDAYLGVGYYDSAKDKSYDGKLTSVTSSNTSVVSVSKLSAYDEKGKKIKIFRLNYKKAGTAKLTVKYTRPNGKKATITKTLVIKKYPNMIKSLKVNGKTVKISKNKLRYTVKAFKNTSAAIKMATKNGWRITEATIDYYGKTYKYKELKKSVVTKGSKISIPKKYDHAIVYIYMYDKNDNRIVYEIDFFR